MEALVGMIVLIFIFILVNLALYKYRKSIGYKNKPYYSLSSKSTNSQKFCTHCGKETTVSIQFCPYCGQKIGGIR